MYHQILVKKKKRKVNREYQECIIVNLVSCLVDVQCQYCGRTDFKNGRGLAMHVKRSKCAGQQLPQTSEANTIPASLPIDTATSLFIAQPLLVTVENLFAIFINVPNLLNHAKEFLLIPCNYVNSFVDITGLLSSMYNGCVFLWTLCTDPDNISTPFLPNSIQPYWNGVYGFLSKHVDMAFYSGRLFGAWKFLVTPIKIDPEAFYSKVNDNPSIPSWMKPSFRNLGKLVELLIGSYLFAKLLFWSFNALIAVTLLIFTLCKERMHSIE